MTQDTATRRRGLMPYVHLLVVYLVWGSTYLAVNLSLHGPGHATPLQLQAARLTCAALMLAALAWLGTGKPVGLTLRHVMGSALSGILLWVFGNGLATLVAQDAPSSFIVMCMGLIPFWTVLFDCLMRRVMPSRHVICGLMAGFVGLVIMVSPTLRPQAGQAILPPGKEWFVLAMLLSGGMCWALGTLVQKRLQGSLPVFWIATCQSGGAALALAVLASIEAAAIPAMPSASQWLAFGFLVICGSIVAMISFQHVVRHFSAAVASTFAYVNPLVGMMLGAMALHESIHPTSILGFLVILTGLWLVLRPHA